MKNCVFNELVILSYEERKALQISFDPHRTIIVGANGTGKSPILKSLYGTFGADAAQTSPAWKQTRASTLLRFTWDGGVYQMLRHGGSFSLFDEVGTLLNQSFRISNDLASFLAAFFDFQLVLVNRKGQPVSPPPAFLFLPYYVDQDSSWTKAWAAFANLTQFSNWKRAVIDYHVGLKPNEYYRLRAAVDATRRRLEVMAVEREGLRRAQKKVGEKLPQSTFSVDLQSFREEVESLLTEADELRIVEENFKGRMAQLRDESLTVHRQIDIVRRSLRETVADFSFATNVAEDEIECPTCGAHYINDFTERFQIATDEDRLRDLLLSLHEEADSRKEEIERIRGQLYENRAAGERIRALLGSRQEQVRLSDLITAQGRQEVRQVFAEGLRDYAFEIKDFEDKQTEQNA
ncbi:MAG TPA: hypothetical protein VJL35_01985, partial [Gemmatimonadaceae bacterium]|nr:hypothetical protein [Gemmatimonadaceae bacterium]